MATTRPSHSGIEWTDGANKLQGVHESFPPGVLNYNADDISLWALGICSMFIGAFQNKLKTQHMLKTAEERRRYAVEATPASALREWCPPGRDLAVGRLGVHKRHLVSTKGALGVHKSCKKLQNVYNWN